MSKHGPQLSVGHFATLTLSTEVAIVLEKLATINLLEGIAKASRRELLLVGLDVILGGNVVFNHLVSALEHAVVKLASSV